MKAIDYNLQWSTGIECMYLKALLFLMITCAISSFRIFPLRSIRKHLKMSECRLLSISGTDPIPPFDKNTVIFMSGATSVGKSAIAMELCRRLDAEIVVADSVQVYKHLNIGANKDSPEELAAVPHHCVDIHDTSMVLNAGEFAVLAAEKIHDIQSRGKLPIVVGGSLMWVNWLVSGIPDAPMPSAQVVQKAQDLLQEAEAAQDWEAGLAILREHDPTREKFPSVNDWYRMRRYLEIALSAKENKSRSSSPVDTDSTQPQSQPQQQQQQPGSRRHLLPGADIRHFFITEHRDSLYRTIDERCEAMLSAGLLQEVTDLLLNEILTPDLIVTRAIGYRQTIEYLLREEYQPGDVDAYTQYLMDFATATRNYAKQQINWHRKGDTSLFVRMDRQLNPNRSPFHRTDKKDPTLRSPPPMTPLTDAVSRATTEVLHWLRVSPAVFQQKVQQQREQGKTYGALMTRKALPWDYCIEKSPDGDPAFVRYMLARMLQAGLLKTGKKRKEIESDDTANTSSSSSSGEWWSDSIWDAQKGVTPDTVKDPVPVWTADEIDIRSQESNHELMKAYTSRLHSLPETLRTSVDQADQLRERLMKERPDVVDRFRKEFFKGERIVSRKVALYEEEV